MPHELGHQLEVAGPLLVPGHGCLEVTRVREPVRADGPEVRQLEGRAEVFAHVTARLPILKLDTKAQATGNDGDLLRLQVDATQLGGDAQPPQLRDDQQLAVRVVEISIHHRAVRDVPVDSTAALLIGGAIAAGSPKPRYEVGWRGRDGKRAPAQLIR